MKKIKLSLIFVLILTAFFACNDTNLKETPFVLSGTLEGIKDGEIILATSPEDGLKIDSVIIKEGEFVFKGDYPVPTKVNLRIVNTRAFRTIYIENAKMTLTGNVNDFANAKIIGSKAQDEFRDFKEQKNIIEEKYKGVMPGSSPRPVGTFVRKSVSAKDLKKRAAKIAKMSEQRQVEIEAFYIRFIKENPTAHHSAVLVSQEVPGKSAIEIEKILSSLDPQMYKNPIIVSLKAKLAEMKDVEIGIDQIMANASNVSYKVDSNFKGEGLKNVIYLSVFSNNNICALQNDGTVQILDPNGKVLGHFKPELKGAPSSIAVDNSNSIYIMCSLQKKVSKKVRGKSYGRMVAMGVECTAFTSEGKQTNNFKLAGLVTATGARVVENNLIVSDFQNKKIAMFDKKTGKESATIEDMRPCCGILDFSVNAKKEILVANLGAFRVQGFDFTGKNLVAFGQRGKSLNDFHGCCNPVSVASLSNGAIVTVEKDPTRIKIYSKEGAKQIAGIDELVTGCSYIPMIVDSKDNLYLASGKKGMVKCVSVN